MRTSALLLWALVLQAGSPLDLPRLGFVADSEGALRPIWGIAGNFVVGLPHLTGVRSAAASDLAVVVKLDDALLVLDREGNELHRWHAPQGSVFVAFAPDGHPGVVHYPETGELWRIEAEPVRFETAIEGRVAAICQPDHDFALLAVRRDVETWLVRIDLATGRIASELRLDDSDRDPLLLRPGGSIVWTVSDLPGKLQAAPVNGRWYVLAERETGRVWIADVASDPERVYRLPAPRVGEEAQ
ncbi:MAG: hypothetical protein ACK5AZ_02190 [Bryobacteraceae bacterium]